MTNGFIQALARSKVSRYFIPWFAGFYQVELNEIKQPMSSFPHLEGFFTRELKDGARPFDERPEVLVSPVDGRLSVVSDVGTEDTFIVKGKTYRLLDLFKRPELGTTFQSGTVIILYLSPANYHRIHVPIGATETEHYYLGKWSWPVNDWGLKHTKALTSNYRLVSLFQLKDVSFAMVSVGALNVNSIVRLPQQSTVYQKMDEYGYFSFGSTVVLVFPQGVLSLDSYESRTVKAGERLGLLNF